MKTSSRLKSPPTIHLNLGSSSAPKTPERKSDVDSSINRDSIVRILTSPTQDPKPDPSPRSPFKTTHDNLSYSHHFLASAAQTQTHNASPPVEKAIQASFQEEKQHVSVLEPA